ncbi:hypothetical protein PC119_g27851, partial [Phytophthora cactorum]
SWEELETAFERYQEEIQKSYKLRTSNTARDRNRDQRRRTALAGKEQVLLDERLEFYTNTFICGSKRKKILRYLKEASGKPILPKDVENLIAEMRRETYTSLDDNVHVSELLRYFGDSPVNAVNTFRDQATKMTSCITFQIAHMRRMARKFPEALCMDATHGTSINRYGTSSVLL